MRIGLLNMKVERAAVEKVVHEKFEAPEHYADCKEALPKKPFRGFLKWFILFDGCVIRGFEVAISTADGAYGNIENNDDYDNIALSTNDAVPEVESNAAAGNNAFSTKVGPAQPHGISKHHLREGASVATCIGLVQLD